MTRPEQKAPALTHESPTREWVMLAIVSAGFIMMTLNWFNISTGFGQIGQEFHLEIPAVALLISMFVLGYGVFHIPGAFLATRIGMRSALAISLAVEGTFALLSALAPTYEMLVVCRLLSGVGAAAFGAIGPAAVSVWFQRRHHALALGIVAACFNVGVVLGLYVWTYLTAGLGWRWSLTAGALLCLLVAGATAVVYRAPNVSARLTGTRLSWTAVRQTLGNRMLWVCGAAFLGAYGAFLGAGQLIGEYGAAREFRPGDVALALLLVAIAGIPGCIVGGWISDRLARRVSVFATAAAASGAFLILLPFVGSSWLWLPVLCTGFLANLGFAVILAVPGSSRDIAPENIGIAVALLLTIMAVGGVALPYAFGLIVPAAGYQSAWIFLGAASTACALIASLAREPRHG